MSKSVLFSIFCAALVFAPQAEAKEIICAGSEPQAVPNTPNHPFVFEAKISPTFSFDASSSEVRSTRGDRLQDATAESGITLSYSTDLSESLDWSVKVGATTDSDWEPDDGDPSTSGFVAGTEIKSKFARIGLWDASFTAGINYENERDDLFEMKLKDSLTTKGSLTFAEKCGNWHWTISTVLERVESSDNLSERWAPGVTISVDREITDNWKWSSSITYQYRRFDIVEDGSRTHHFGLAKTGLKWTKDLGADFELTAAASLAARITNVERTDIFRDSASVFVNPVITIKKRFGG